MAKANKDGWIRHRGGKCPVEAGTLVDVRYRNGLKVESHFLTSDIKASQISLEKVWNHEGDDCDIMAYRIHKPEIEQSVVEIAVDGPLDWRDRIRQIEAEEAKRNEEHRQAIEALEEERLSLVQKLEGEGLKLIESKAACDGMPAEDMSDYRNWKVGDIAEVISTDVFCGDRLSVGDKVPITGIDEDGTITAAPGYWGFPGQEYKFHSRP